MRGTWLLESTDQVVRLICMWMEVKPVIERTRDEDEAGEVDCEAEREDDGEPDVAQGADGTGSEMARLLGPPLVLGAPEPELEGGVGCGALAERGLRWGALAPGGDRSARRRLRGPCVSTRAGLVGSM